MKKKRIINYTFNSFIGVGRICVFFIFFFQFCFGQIYHSGEVEIVGEDQITIVTNEKVETGSIYVSDGTIISDSENLLVGKIITPHLGNNHTPKQKEEAKKKSISNKKTHEFIQLRQKEVFVFNQNSGEIFNATKRNIIFALQNSPDQFKTALSAVFSPIKKRIVESSTQGLSQENLETKTIQKFNFEIRPPPNYFLI